MGDKDVHCVLEYTNDLRVWSAFFEGNLIIRLQLQEDYEKG